MTCPICEGFGVDPNTVTENLKGEPCQICGGSGELPVSDRSSFSEREIIDEIVDDELGIKDDVRRKRAS